MITRKCDNITYWTYTDAMFSLSIANSSFVIFSLKIFNLYLVYVCILLFGESECILYPKDRCEKNDCFDQVSNTNNGTCLIYNTSVCINYFSEFSHSPEKELFSENESKFSASVYPYTAEFYENYKKFSRSAINITFNISHVDIKGLALKINTKDSSKTICRILNFQNMNSSVPLYLFYDCLFNLVKHHIQNVQMDFISLPMNDKLSYFVFIPGSKLPSTCRWQPLIMIFRGNLRNRIVQVKFSQASPLLNVTYYLVKLIQTVSGKENLLTVSPYLESHMISVEFQSVEAGYYNIAVKSVTKEDNDCWIETESFLVGSSQFSLLLILSICVLVILILSALVFLKMSLHNIFKLKTSAKPRVLLLHSYDCSAHEQFVTAFIDYIEEQQCHVKVSTIYGNLDDGKKWIKNKYNECDVIIFFVSAGLFHTLDTKNFLPLKKGHQLLKATKFILNFEEFGKKRICKVCFPYSNKNHIPDRLKTDTGECYMLPQEMNNLFNFVYNCRPYIPCTNLFPSLCNNNLESSTAGRTLLERMRAVQEAVNRNSHIIILLTGSANLNSLDNGESEESSYSLDSLDFEEKSDSFIINFLQKKIKKKFQSKESIPSEESFNISSSQSSSSSSLNKDVIEVNLLESYGDSNEDE